MRPIKWILCLVLSEFSMGAFFQAAIAEEGFLVSTNIEGVQAFKAPPKDFVASTASDDDLARYGFPPRPDQRSHPKEYAVWQRIVAGQSSRIIPNLVQTQNRHGPAKIVAEAKTGATTIATTSTNWSGFAVVDSSNPFRSAGSQVGALIEVPKGFCNNIAANGGHSSIWVGIDGYGSNDVLQTGITADLSCPGGQIAQHAWFEWFPNYEIAISNMPISPGDVFSADVWIAGGKAFIGIENRNTNASFTLALDPPSGVTLVGNSVEWIVERYEINNKLQQLPNYYSVMMTDVLALTYPTPNQLNVYYPGSSPTGVIYDITMLDDNGNPESTGYLVPYNPAQPGTLAFIANK